MRHLSRKHGELEAVYELAEPLGRHGMAAGADEILGFCPASMRLRLELGTLVR